MKRGGGVVRRSGSSGFLSTGRALATVLLLANSAPRGVAESLDEVLEPRQSAAEKQLEAATQATLNASTAAAAALPRHYPAAVRHLRFPEGPRFADVPKVDALKGAIGKGAQQAAEKKFRELNEAAKRQKEKWSRPEDLPTCTAAKEEKIALKAAKGGGEETVIQDLLFLGSDPPLDFETRYGESVEVQRLNQGADPISRGFAEGARITCVPVRLRLTTHALYRLEGEAALQRFEDKRFDARKKDEGKGAGDENEKKVR